MEESPGRRQREGPEVGERFDVGYFGGKATVSLGWMGREERVLRGGIWFSHGGGRL